MSTPSPPPHDDDEAFRRIIEGFAEDDGDPVPRWPASEDLDDGPGPPPAAPPAPVPEAPPAPAVEPLPGWVEPAALEDQGHYTPPPPPRLPRVRLRTVLALLILLSGFAILFVPFKVGLDDTAPSLLLGMALTTGGAAMLIGGLRDTGDDRGPDDGAVV